MRVRARLTITIAGLTTLTIFACTSATGEVRGGAARFDAASPEALVVPITEPDYADAPTSSWRGIYRDFFGRRAKASCAGTGACHDAATKSGAVRSGFVCADLAGCWTSLRTSKPSNPAVSKVALVEESDIAAPDGAHLFDVLRFRGADGTLFPNKNMPRVPRDYAYSAAEIARIQAWIKAGALND